MTHRGPFQPRPFCDSVRWYQFVTTNIFNNTLKCEFLGLTNPVLPIDQAQAARFIQHSFVSSPVSLESAIKNSAQAKNFYFTPHPVCTRRIVYLCWRYLAWRLLQSSHCWKSRWDVAGCVGLPVCLTLPCGRVGNAPLQKRVPMAGFPLSGLPLSFQPPEADFIFPHPLREAKQNFVYTSLKKKGKFGTWSYLLCE